MSREKKQKQIHLHQNNYEAKTVEIIVVGEGASAVCAPESTPAARSAKLKLGTRMSEEHEKASWRITTMKKHFSPRSFAFVKSSELSLARSALIRSVEDSSRAF
jgi:hypothetical protein